MSTSFQSFTPRVLPLDYDSLLSQNGCEAESGNAYFDVEPFTTICIQPHDPTDFRFAQLDTISQFYGPTAPNVTEKPFLSLWEAKVGSVGVLIGRQGAAPNISSLYPATKPTKLSGSFNRFGMLFLAIQKDSTTIEVSRYTDAEGNTQVISFSGKSAVLFNIGLLLHRDPEQPGVVVYYLKAERPRVLFTRFETENFAQERIVIPDLRVPLVRLISAFAFGTKLYLLATDTQGRDITLKSIDYGALIFDNASETIGFLSGYVFEAAVPVSTPEEKSNLILAFNSGLVFSPIKSPDPQPEEEAAKLTLAFLEGAVI